MRWSAAPQGGCAIASWRWSTVTAAVTATGWCSTSGTYSFSRGSRRHGQTPAAISDATSRDLPSRRIRRASGRRRARAGRPMHTGFGTIANEHSLSRATGRRPVEPSSSGATAPAAPAGYELGAGPPLGVDDLPTPEEAFGARRIGLKETITLVIGPSVIALGLSIGSGEWLLAPLAIGTEGWVGVGFVALLSILLQAFYNVEIGRYVVATGEVPSIGFGRVPPGMYIGTILAVLLFYLAFITGGWAAGAGEGLFTLFTGDIPGEGDQNTSNWLAVALMVVVFVITLIGRKISRTLELVNWVLVAFILSTVTLAAILLTSASDWGDGLEGLFRPSLPPDGVDATTIGAVAGFAAMASGLNYVFMNYYRDKGYGMGSKAGYIPALLGGERHEV